MSKALREFLKSTTFKKFSIIKKIKKKNIFVLIFIFYFVYKFFSSFVNSESAALEFLIFESVASAILFSSISAIFTGLKKVIG